MKIVVEVSEKDYLNFMLQYDNGILDEKTPSHRAKIAIAEGTPLPKENDVLDKIRAEIMELDDINPDYPMDMTVHISRYAVLQIIDKYKEESEEGAEDGQTCKS